jgi:hypothetical protein
LGTFKAVLRIDPDADPDSSCHFDADPETTFHSDADLNPDPTFLRIRIWILFLVKLMRVCHHGFKDPPRPHFEPSCTSIVSVYGPPMLHAVRSSSGPEFLMRIRILL